MAYIDEAARSNVRLIAAINKSKAIPAATKKSMERYEDFMKAKGLSDRTIAKNLYCLAVFLKAVGNKPLERLNKDDMIRVIGLIERSAYSVKTKQNIKISVKALYKHLIGDDVQYPPIVQWIPTRINESKRVLPEDILSEDDVLRILDAARIDRDKALISLLFDSGVRVGELLGLRIKDVDLESSPAHIVVTGKTGMRKIPIMFSVPYVGRYLESCKSVRKPNDYLWERYGKWAKYNKPLDRSGVAVILKDMAKKAKITKAVNPHAFRHARATYYANRLTEQQLKMFFGWTGGSRMAATYVHLSGRDLDNGVLQANGYKVQELSEPRLKVKICPRCRQSNGVDQLYCGRCGSALSIEVAMAQDKRNEIYAEMYTDPDIVKAIAKHQAKKQIIKKEV